MTYSIVVCAAIGTDRAENTPPLLLFTGCCLVTASYCESTILALSEYATILNEVYKLWSFLHYPVVAVLGSNIFHSKAFQNSISLCEIWKSYGVVFRFMTPCSLLGNTRLSEKCNVCPCPEDGDNRIFRDVSNIHNTVLCHNSEDYKQVRKCTHSLKYLTRFATFCLITSETARLAETCVTLRYVFSQ
jgi:hypothetical protein